MTQPTQQEPNATQLLSINEISYTLQQPVALPQGELTTVTLRRANSGTLLQARAMIANNKALGVALINDGLTMGVYSMRLSLVRTNLPQTPADWVNYLSQTDLMELLERFNALGEGFGTDLEAYRLEVARRTNAEEQRREAAMTFPEGASTF